MQSPLSVWPLHLSNARIEAALPILSWILSKYSPISCLMFFPDIEHLMKKFGVDIFTSFCVTVLPNCPLYYCNTRNNGPVNFRAALMVIWIVYECIVLFLPITAASTIFGPRIASVHLDPIS